MTVYDLLELMWAVDRFRLVSIEDYHTVLYEDEADPGLVADRYVLDIPVEYFGIADKDTMEFYVHEADFDPF
jgi:hypothetical protein